MICDPRMLTPRSSRTRFPFPASGFRSSELVADASHGDDVRRRGGIIFNLLPQPADVHVDGARAAVVVVSPDMLEGGVAGKNPGGGADQEAPPLEILRRQGDLPAVPHDLVRGGVQLHVSCAL